VDATVQLRIAQHPTALDDYYCSVV
jgi:hypothetical protein